MSLLKHRHLPNSTLPQYYDHIHQYNINQYNKDKLLNPSIINHKHKPLFNIKDLWIGLSRQQCLKIADQYQLTLTNFAHWLYIEELDLILSFQHQQCINVDRI